MAERTKIGLHALRALREAAPETVIHDSEVIGFGARRLRSGQISFVIRYRNSAGTLKLHTIGRWGVFTPDQARDEARDLLQSVRRGADPVAERRAKREALTIEQLCTRYLEAAEGGRLLLHRKGVAKRPKTLASDRGRLFAHVIPLLGKIPVDEVTRAQVERAMEAIIAGKTAVKPAGKRKAGSLPRGGAGAAARTIGLLGAVFTWAERQGYRTTGNPCRGIVRPADHRRDRRLSDGEYQTLAKALRKAAPSDTWPYVPAAIRFLALTGWRAGEMLGLRWEHVDAARRTAFLPMTKSGRSVRPLSNAAMDILTGLPRIADGEHVFPSGRGGMMTGWRRPWDRIIKEAGLPSDVTPHVLRHTFASVAHDEGLSDLAIAGLLGHAVHSVTSRYVHGADAVLLAAADRVADAVVRRMGEAAQKGTIVAFQGAGA